MKFWSYRLGFIACLSVFCFISEVKETFSITINHDIDSHSSKILKTSSFILAQKSSLKATDPEAQKLIDEGIKLFEEETEDSLRQALIKWKQALKIVNRQKDKETEATILALMGRTYEILEDSQQALEKYTQSIAILTDINETENLALVYLKRGILSRHLSDFEAALNDYNQALYLESNLPLAYYERGYIYLELKKYEEAVKDFEQVIKANPESADAYYLRGFAKSRSNVYSEQEVIDDLTNAIELNPNFSIAYYVRGYVYIDLEKYENAINDFNETIRINPNNYKAYYERALAKSNINGYSSEEIVDDFNNSINLAPEFASAYASLGRFYHEIQEIKMAKENFELAALLAHQQNNDTLYQKVISGINSIATQQYEQGQINDSLKTYQQILNISQITKDKPNEGFSLNEIGDIYDYLGEYAKSIAAYKRALIVNKTGQNSNAQLIKTLYSLGEIYSDLGQYQESLDYFDEALQVYCGQTQKLNTSQNLTFEELFNTTLIDARNMTFEEISNLSCFVTGTETGSPIINMSIKRVEQRIHEGMGATFLGLGKYENALERFEITLLMHEVFRSFNLDITRDKSVTFSNIGLTYYFLKNNKESLNYFNKALKIHQELDDNIAQGKTLSNIGMVHFRQKNYDEALNYFNQALDIHQKFKNKPSEAKVFHNLGLVYMNLTDYYLAENFLKQAIKIDQSLDKDLKNDEKISLFDTKIGTYKLLQQALAKQNKITESLEIAEQSRTKVLAELLGTKISNDSQFENNPPNITTLRQIASQQKATLVEYSVINNQLIYVWVIPPSGEITFKEINLTSLDTPIAELVKITRDSIGVRGRGETDNNTETKGCKNNQKCLQQLHSILIEPIASSLPKDPNAKVIFIPHEQLFLVPFAALQDQEGNYLIEKHTIVTAPSIQVLDLTQKIRQQQQPPSDMLIVGIDKISYSNPPAVPPLDNAEKEALTIAKLYNTQAIIGEKATETLIKEKMSDAGVIHLATHGLLEELKPLQNLTPEELKRFDLLEYKIPGAIALTPSESDNGLLTANEILKLKLKAQLVVLSACNTGKGDITGDGVVGLSRSLMEAGVPSVLVSLWYVPDAPTSDLMIEFHRQWKQGKNKAQALREAMLETMKNHPDPKNWAAFTLIGESE